MRKRSGKAWPGAALAVMLIAGAVTVSGGRTAARDGTVIFQRNSLYHHIYVLQQGTVRHLRFGRQAGIYQTSVDTARPHRHVHEYTELAMCGLLYNPSPRRVLIIGLGGGVMPRVLRRHFPQAEIDVAEIDPDIPPIAEYYFGFREDERLRVHVNDGRTFIRRLRRQDPVPRYDYIVLDAFSGDYIPFHLMTREFLEEVKGVLSDDGVVVANIFSNNRLADAQLATFFNVFGWCQVFLGGRSANAMLVSAGSEVEPLTAARALQHGEWLHWEHDFAFDMRVVARRLRPGLRPARNAPVLTDDRAPVHHLRRQPPTDPWAETHDVVELRDGTRHEGWVLQLTQQQVIFQLKGQEGEAARTWPLGQVRTVTIEGRQEFPAAQ